MQKNSLDKDKDKYSIAERIFIEEAIMKSRILVPLIVLAFVLNAKGQQYWVMLQEYPSPGEGARGLYYGGKLLWNVDNEAQTVFTLNPYNLEVIDIYPSPVDQPWGITWANNRFWMTNFGWETSQLVKLQSDTFLVDVVYDFPGYYFYGLTCDSTNQHLWISAMSHGYTKYLLEFDAVAGQVVQWHPWYGNWNLGLQYWDDCLWVNSSTWNYPDYTYIYELSTGTYDDMLICPLAVPEGIATNGLVWWISHFRDNAPYIWKLIPPGAVVHDIAAHSPIFPTPGNLQLQTFDPQFCFINYGSLPEGNVPFVCQIDETLTSAQIYYCEVQIPDTIAPDEIIEVTFAQVDSLDLQPDTDYTFTFYSDLFLDDYRSNDTMRVYVHTEGVHDLAVLAILEPDTSEALSQIMPTIVVQNLGDYLEPTAPVNLEIEHPDGSLSELSAEAIDLAVNEIDTIAFAPFDPPEPGEYLFTFDGVLPGDLYPENDLLSINCLIGQLHDPVPKLLCHL